MITVYTAGVFLPDHRRQEWIEREMGRELTRMALRPIEGTWQLSAMNGEQGSHKMPFRVVVTMPAIWLGLRGLGLQGDYVWRPSCFGVGYRGRGTWDRRTFDDAQAIAWLLAGER